MLTMIIFRLFQMDYEAGLFVIIFYLNLNTLGIRFPILFLPIHPNIFQTGAPY